MSAVVDIKAACDNNSARLHEHHGSTSFIRNRYIYNKNIHNTHFPWLRLWVLSFQGVLLDGRQGRVEQQPVIHPESSVEGGGHGDLSPRDDLATQSLRFTGTPFANMRS